MMTAPAVQASGIAASRKRIAAFQLFRPVTLDETCGLLAEQPDAVLHAGGIDLVNRMKAGLVAPAVIALGDVAELKDVRRAGVMIEIGAATSHLQLEHDPLLASALPCMAEYISGLGNVRIRAQGTIGGNIMAADPGYEMPALLAALDAIFHFIGRADGRRYQVPARTFRSSDSSDLLAVIAIPQRSMTVAWSRELRPALGVVASLQWDGDTIQSGFGALSGRGPIGEPIELEKPIPRHDMAGQVDALAECWAARLPLASIPGAPKPDYHRHVAAVLMRRLLGAMARGSQ